MTTRDELSARQMALSKALEKVLREAILELPPAEQTKIWKVYRRVSKLLEAAGADAGAVAFLLLQIECNRSMQAPYPLAPGFINMGDKMLRRAMSDDPEVFMEGVLQ